MRWQLEEQMSQAEFQDWLEEYRRRPWGEDIEDLRMGTIASTIANANSVNRSFAPADFIPRFGPLPDQSDDELEADCRAYFSTLRGRA